MFVNRSLGNYVQHFDLVEKLIRLVGQHEFSSHISPHPCTDTSIFNAHNKSCNRCALMYMRKYQVWVPKMLKGVIKSITRSQQANKMLVKAQQNEENKVIVSSV